MRQVVGLLIAKGSLEHFLVHASEEQDVVCATGDGRRPNGGEVGGRSRSTRDTRYAGCFVFAEVVGHVDRALRLCLQVPNLDGVGALLAGSVEAAYEQQFRPVAAVLYGEAGLQSALVGFRESLPTGCALPVVQRVNHLIGFAVGLSARHVDDSIGEGCCQLVESYRQRRKRRRGAFFQQIHISKRGLAVSSAADADDAFRNSDAGAIGSGVGQVAQLLPAVRVADGESEDVGIESLLAPCGSGRLREVAAASHDEPVARHTCEGCRHTLHAVADHQLRQVVNTKAIELTVVVLVAAACCQYGKQHERNRDSQLLHNQYPLFSLG